jgi:hypothetical protein
MLKGRVSEFLEEFFGAVNKAHTGIIAFVGKIVTNANYLCEHTKNKEY